MTDSERHFSFLSKNWDFKLYNLAWNHLCEGQWELSRVHLRALFDVSPALSLSFLASVVQCEQNNDPGFRLQLSSSIPSVAHFRYFCSEESRFLSQKLNTFSKVDTTTDAAAKLTLLLACVAEAAKPSTAFSEAVVTEMLSFFKLPPRTFPSPLGVMALKQLKSVCAKLPELGGIVFESLCAVGEPVRKQLLQVYLDLVAELVLEQQNLSLGCGLLAYLDVSEETHLAQQEEVFLSIVNQTTAPTPSATTHSPPLAPGSAVEEGWEWEWLRRLWRECVASDSLSPVSIRQHVYQGLLGRLDTQGASSLRYYCSLELRQWQERLDLVDPPSEATTGKVSAPTSSFYYALLELKGSLVESSEARSGGLVPVSWPPPSLAGLPVGGDVSGLLRVDVSAANGRFWREQFVALQVSGFSVILLEQVMHQALSKIQSSEFSTVVNKILLPFPHLRPVVALMGRSYFADCLDTQTKLLDALWGHPQVSPIPHEPLSLGGMFAVHCNHLAHSLAQAKWVAALFAGRPCVPPPQFLVFEDGVSVESDDFVLALFDAFVEGRSLLLAVANLLPHFVAEDTLLPRLHSRPVFDLESSQCQAADLMLWHSFCTLYGIAWICHNDAFQTDSCSSWSCVSECMQCVQEHCAAVVAADADTFVGLCQDVIALLFCSRSSLKQPTEASPASRPSGIHHDPYFAASLLTMQMVLSMLISVLRENARVDAENHVETNLDLDGNAGDSRLSQLQKCVEGLLLRMRVVQLLLPLLHAEHPKGESEFTFGPYLFASPSTLFGICLRLRRFDECEELISFFDLSSDRLHRLVIQSRAHIHCTKLLKKLNKDGSGLVDEHFEALGEVITAACQPGSTFVTAHRLDDLCLRLDLAITAASPSPALSRWCLQCATAAAGAASSATLTGAGLRVWSRLSCAASSTTSNEEMFLCPPVLERLLTSFQAILSADHSHNTSLSELLTRVTELPGNDDADDKVVTAGDLAIHEAGLDRLLEATGASDSGLAPSGLSVEMLKELIGTFAGSWQEIDGDDTPDPKSPELLLSSSPSSLCYLHQFLSYIDKVSSILYPTTIPNTLSFLDHTPSDLLLEAFFPEPSLQTIF